MTSDRALRPARHGRVSGAGDGLAFETLIDREPEDERVTGREATLHLVQVRHDALVGDRTVKLGVAVALGGGTRRELRDDVGPLGLRAYPVARHRLDAVADHRAAVAGHRPLDLALVVVDEQTRRHEVPQPLLHAIELHRPRDRVGGAAAELALVVDGRALRAKVGRRRQRQEILRRRGVQVVALVGLVGDPSVMANLTWLGHDTS